MKKFLVSSAVAFALFQGASLAQTFAKVNGSEITEKDIAHLMRPMPGVSFAQLPENAKGQLVEQAVERRLFIEQAKKDRIQDTKEYKENLANLQDELLFESFMRKFMEKIKVSNAEIEKFYNENKDKFVRPETVEASHILVQSDKEAKDIIAELKKAKNINDKFKELAQAKSRDNSAANGGYLGQFAKAQMVPEFSEVAFSLKKGDYSKNPVKTQFGYHIILIHDKKPAGTFTLNEVKPQIEQNLRFKKFQEEIQKEAAKLRKNAKIEIIK
ncbi:MAG: peptidyl-prolyl cis-trans isomerase [Helicobacter sp.]|nr:peptidyl-prolyl cis-trans isomerase [Helicobacter sp.]